MVPDVLPEKFETVNVPEVNLEFGKWYAYKY
jgi:hypothetical protein